MLYCIMIFKIKLIKYRHHFFVFKQAIYRHCIKQYVERKQIMFLHEQLKCLRMFDKYCTKSTSFVTKHPNTSWASLCEQHLFFEQLILQFHLLVLQKSHISPLELPHYIIYFLNAYCLAFCELCISAYVFFSLVMFNQTVNIV